MRYHLHLLLIILLVDCSSNSGKVDTQQKPAKALVPMEELFNYNLEQMQNTFGVENVKSGGPDGNYRFLIFEGTDKELTVQDLSDGVVQVTAMARPGTKTIDSLQGWSIKSGYHIGMTKDEMFKLAGGEPKSGLVGPGSRYYTVSSTEFEEVSVVIDQDTAEMITILRRPKAQTKEAAGPNVCVFEGFGEGQDCPHYEFSCKTFLHVETRLDDEGSALWANIERYEGKKFEIEWKDSEMFPCYATINGDTLAGKVTGQVITKLKLVK